MLLGLMVLVKPLDMGTAFKNKQLYKLRDMFLKVHMTANKKNGQNFGL